MPRRRRDGHRAVDRGTNLSGQPVRTVHHLGKTRPCLSHCPVMPDLAPTLCKSMAIAPVQRRPTLVYLSRCHIIIPPVISPMVQQAVRRILDRLHRSRSTPYITEPTHFLPRYPSCRRVIKVPTSIMRYIIRILYHLYYLRSGRIMH